jgi:hypothetical protein
MVIAIRCVPEEAETGQSWPVSRHYSSGVTIPV